MGWREGQGPCGGGRARAHGVEGGLVFGLGRGCWPWRGRGLAEVAAARIAGTTAPPSPPPPPPPPPSPGCTAAAPALHHRTLHLLWLIGPANQPTQLPAGQNNNFVNDGQSNQDFQLNLSDSYITSKNFAACKSGPEIFLLKAKVRQPRTIFASCRFVPSYFENVAQLSATKYQQTSLLENLVKSTQKIQ